MHDVAEVMTRQNDLAAKVALGRSFFWPVSKNCAPATFDPHFMEQNWLVGILQESDHAEAKNLCGIRRCTARMGTRQNMLAFKVQSLLV